MTTPHRPKLHRGSPRVNEMWEAMIWPRLLLVPRLAGSMSRVGISLIAVVLIALLARIPEIFLGANVGPAAEIGRLAPRAFTRVGEGVAAMRPGEIGGGIWDLCMIPGPLFTKYPVSSAAVLAMVLCVWAVAGGAVCRMAAEEYALGERLAWTKGLAFSIRHLRSLVGAMLAPLAVVGAAAVLMGVGGWALLGVTGVQVVGGGMFFLALLVSLLAIIGLAGFVLGFPLIPAAVVCEGADTIDALQRVYAYVLDRPGRMIVYLLILAAQAVVVSAILALLAGGVVEFARWSVTMFTGEAPTAAIIDAVRGLSPTADSGWSLRAMSRGVRFWSQIPGLLVVSAMVSFYFCGSSVLYLLVREVADGQEPADLWSPGMIAGTMAPTHEPEGDEDDNF